MPGSPLVDGVYTLYTIEGPQMWRCLFASHQAVILARNTYGEETVTLSLDKFNRLCAGDTVRKPSGPKDSLIAWWRND